MRKILFLLIWSGIVCASYAEQQAISIGIVGLQTDLGAVDTVKAQAFLNSLNNAMSQRRGFEVIEKSRVDSTKLAQGHSLQSFCDRDCLQKIGQALNANKLLTIQASMTDTVSGESSLKVSLLLYDETSGSVEKTIDLDRPDAGLAVRQLAAYLMPSDPATEAEEEKTMPAWHPASSDTSNANSQSKGKSHFGIDLSQFGLILGGNYSWFYGGAANKMSSLVDSTYFSDGQNPFGYITDPSHGIATPTGMVGPVGGAFLRLDWGDYVYTRFELSYLWKSAEYQKTISVGETYTQAADTLQMLQEIAGSDSLLPGQRRYDITNAYLEMPILIGVNVTRNFSVFAGPQLSYLLTHNFTAYFTQSDNALTDPPLTGKQTYTLNVKMAKFDFGVLTGFNFEINQQVQIGLRYECGFLPILNRSPAPDIKTQSVQLVASLNFSEF